MDGIDIDTLEPESHPLVAQPQANAGAVADSAPSRKANVEKWINRILDAKEHHKKAFERMKKCQKIAATGADDDWPEGNYTVPVLLRHVNVAVASLYARNPTAVAKRKPKVQYRLWDGNMESLKAAMQAALPQPAVPVQPGMVPDPTTPMLPGDPNAMALLQEVQDVHNQNVQMDRAAKTLELLFHHYQGEQDAGYKQQLKACVRRTKVCSVAWSKLGFQRALEPNPDVTSKIADATSKIETLNRLMAEAAEGELQEHQAEMDTLKSLLADLQQAPELIVAEGPTWGFPKADAIIIDPECVHLKTLAGANWVAHEFPPMTPEYIKETYGVDVGTNFKACDANKKADKSQQQFARVWEVQDKRTQQCFTVCEGYPDFLKAPAEPDVKVSRFWTVFPLVFNEIEHDDEIYPPSDVWASRWMQKEYNTVRQGLREHRQQNRPKYAAIKGKLEETDKVKLSTGESGAIVELSAMGTGEKIDDIIQAIKTVNIDPNLYEVLSIQGDIERTIGSAAADLGAAQADVTATQSSIVESGRSTMNSDNVDDLDDWLSEMARAQGELMLLELDPQTVTEIVGPGAVWPSSPPTRQQISKDLWLEVKAGSSGRPNRAAELANMERGMPYILQLPGFNPIPLGKRYGELLDLPVEELMAEGMPSIQAMNAIAAKPAGGSGDPQAADGEAQGAQGANNAPSTAPNEPGPQPAMPAPGEETSPEMQFGA